MRSSGPDRRAAGPGRDARGRRSSQAAAAADRVGEIVLSLYAKGLTTGEFSVAARGRSMPRTEAYSL